MLHKQASRNRSGVLFILILAFALFSFISLSVAPVSAETPADVPVKAYVNDYANVLTSDQVTQLTAQLQQLESSGAAQMSVVTIHTLAGQDIESFSLQLSQGVLGDKAKNNGLLLLVAVDDHLYRFEVGRGLEADLNDAKIGRIGRTYLVPAFRQNDYGKGISDATSAVSAILLNDTNSTFYQDTAASDPSTAPPSLLAIAFMAIWALLSLLPFLVPVLFIILAIRASRSKSTKKKQKEDRYLTAAFILSSMMRGGRGGGGSGGFGGGGFSGGGGSFGGGGASGGW